MNKISKIYLTLSLLFLLIGTVFFIVGILGKGYSYVNSTDLISFSGKPINKEMAQVATMEKLDQFNSVKINSQSMNIRIEQSSDENGYISYNLPASYGDKISYSVQNGELTIDEISTKKAKLNINIFSFFSDKDSNTSHLTLYIPKQMSAEYLSIKSNFGDISINQLTAKKASIKLNAGNVNLTRCNLSSVKATLDFGDFESKDSTISESDFNISKGDFESKYDKYSGTIRVNCSFGDITFENDPLYMKKLNLLTQTSFGDIEGLPKENLSSEPKEASLYLKTDNGDIEFES